MDTHSKIAQRCRNIFSRHHSTVVLLALALLPLPSARASSPLDKQLNSDYVGKVLTLRRFYDGEHLTFHSDGSLKTSASVGPWTLDGQIEVQKVELHDGVLIIRGRRIHRIFDAQLKPLDELTAVENFKDKKEKDLGKALRRLMVEVEIELPGEKPEEKSVTAAMHAVFLANSESMMDIVPSYWRAYFAKQEGAPAPPVNAAVPTFKPGAGMSPPRVTYQPDPDYSEEARKAKFQGTMVMSLVVDPSGAARDLQINRPLGLGLDEKAVEAVSSWRFKPALKDGTPMAVQINVEVRFRLY